MDIALLDGLVVVDFSGPPAALTGRLLADLGADVIRAGPEVDATWEHGTRRVTDHELDALLAAARIVIDTPGVECAPLVDPTTVSHAAWVRVTPFGLRGPRAHWRATDLGVMASSGNQYATGDPDRAPVRPSQPAAYAHVGPEAAFAALTAVASGYTGVVDVSMQEAVFVANMSTPSRFPQSGHRGTRMGANIGRTREIWPTLDGYVSFGLRGGAARVPSLERITALVAADGIDAPALTGRDWTAYHHNDVPDAELAAIEAPIAAYFARHTMADLYEIACETNLMLAPINSPGAILESAQLAAREFWTTIDTPNGPARIPARPALVRVPPPSVPASNPVTERTHFDVRPGPWSGTRILEFGSGAAGPIATRYFVEHGATVLRIESKGRPDFLRVYALPNPHGLEGSVMFDGLNVGKRDLTLNLKHPDAVALVRRLVTEWADAVVENFAPRAMRGFGLDIDSLWSLRPDLVMASACLNGQTGPHRDYPGFGGQGSALGGYNFVTGWPDREPLGPHGTITDSLAPRFVAACLAAGLLHRRATGTGVYIDLSQVESAIYSLSPAVLAYQRDRVAAGRLGNREIGVAISGVFPTLDEGAVPDRWVAIRAVDDREWHVIATHAELDGSLDDLDDREAAIAAWTRTRTRAAVAEELQALGIEAVPVNDFGDLHDDPQVAHRDHFVALDHPYLGPSLYERNGVRFVDADTHAYDRAGPTLGQDTDTVLVDILGLERSEIRRLREAGAVE